MKDRKRVVSVFFSLLLFSRVLCGFADVADKQGGTGNPKQARQSAEERAGERDQQPTNDARHVFESVEASGTESAQAAEQTKSEEMHNQEARIQESIKNASWFMGVCTALQFLASAAGIFFIWRTLKEASRSSAAALQAVTKMEEVADESVRPWLSVTCNLDGNFSKWQAESGQDAFIINVECEVENHGCSPATSVIWKADIGLRESGKSKWDTFCEDMKASPEKDAQAIFPGKKIKLRSGVALLQSAVDAREGDFFTLFVYGCVQYKSQHFAGVRQTRFAFDFVVPNGNLAAFMIGDLDTLGALNRSPLALTPTPLISAD